MCRKLVVVNKLSLGSRELGWECFSFPKREVVELTTKQLKDAITGRFQNIRPYDKGNGLSLGNLKTFKEAQLIQTYVAYIKNWDKAGGLSEQ